MDITALLAQTLAGVVAVPALNVLKRAARLEGAPMAWAAFVASIVLGGITCVMTGKLASNALNPETLFTSATVIFSVSQIVYRSIKDRIK